MGASFEKFDRGRPHDASLFVTRLTFFAGMGALQCPTRTFVIETFFAAWPPINKMRISALVLMMTLFTISFVIGNSTVKALALANFAHQFLMTLKTGALTELPSRGVTLGALRKAFELRMGFGQFAWRKEVSPGCAGQTKPRNEKAGSQVKIHR